MGNAANTATHPPPSSPYYLNISSSVITLGCGLSISPSAPFDTSSSPSAQLCPAAETYVVSSVDTVGAYCSNFKSLLTLSI